MFINMFIYKNVYKGCFMFKKQFTTPVVLSTGLFNIQFEGQHPSTILIPLKLLFI